MVPLGSVPPIEDGRGPLKGGQGSVGIKQGTRWFPEEVETPGVPDEICVGAGIEAFNARYLGGRVGVNLGKSSVLMGAWLATVVQV
jgi:hypothetical protein